MKQITFHFAAVIAVFISILTNIPSHAAKEPRPLITDQRIKQLAYDPNQVYEIVGTYGYQTMIEFAHDEPVKVRTIGDSIAWQTFIKGNRIFIKPVEPDAATNMTIVTNKRTYIFKLDSSAKQDDATFLVRFVYPNANMTEVLSSGSLDQTSGRLAESTSSPDLNLNYLSAGDKNAIQLKRVFDDGEFTYFQFNKNAEIPSFYIVGSDGTESVVNTRREGSYIVVERTGQMFTLRNGESYLCVQNTVNQPDTIKTASVAGDFL